MKFQLRPKGQGELSQEKMGMEGHPAFTFIKKEGKRNGKERGNKVTYLMDIVLFIM